MIYPFECNECGNVVDIHSAPFHPPPAPTCCKKVMFRIYGCHIDTSACRDANHIPANKRVVRSGIVAGKGDVVPEQAERKFYEHIQHRRQVLKDAGQKGDFRHTHSVPADLYHGKIRETGDKNYWQDPKNVARHKDCKVS